MRLEATSLARPVSTSREVEPHLTPASPDKLRDAIARAYKKLTGHAPSAVTLDVLTAQASLETASGTRMFNFNFGGIKGRGPTGETAHCKTHEVIAGKDVTIRDGFRAYRTLDEGAVDYVKLMRDQFPRAMEQAARGNVSEFAKALKQSHYYTADETAYATALHGLMPGGGSKEASLRSPAPSDSAFSVPPASMVGPSSAGSFVDDAQLARVMDAIGRHRTTLEPDEDE